MGYVLLAGIVSERLGLSKRAQQAHDIVQAWDLSTVPRKTVLATAERTLRLANGTMEALGDIRKWTYAVDLAGSGMGPAFIRGMLDERIAAIKEKAPVLEAYTKGDAGSDRLKLLIQQTLVATRHGILVIEALVDTFAEVSGVANTMAVAEFVDGVIEAAKAIVKGIGKGLELTATIVKWSAIGFGLYLVWKHMAKKKRSR